MTISLPARSGARPGSSLPGRGLLARRTGGVSTQGRAPRAGRAHNPALGGWTPPPATILFLAAVLVLVTACAGTSPDRIVYVSIDSAVTAVQSGLQVFNEQYQGGAASPDPAVRQKWDDRRGRAKDAYEKFQVTARAATRLAQEATDPEHGTSAVRLASDAAYEALAIIQAFTRGPR